MTASELTAVSITRVQRGTLVIQMCCQKTRGRGRRRERSVLTYNNGDVLNLSEKNTQSHSKPEVPVPQSRCPGFPGTAAAAPPSSALLGGASCPRALPRGLCPWLHQKLISKCHHIVEQSINIWFWGNTGPACHKGRNKFQ